jgi:membrane protease YdiL (CAAX protease family)
MDNENRPQLEESHAIAGIVEQPKKQNFRPILYFILTYAITLAFWIPAALIQKNLFELPTIILFILGSMAPSLVGISLVYLTLEKEHIKEFWIRAFSFKRIKLGWYGIIFGLNLLPTIIAMIVGVGLGKQDVNFFEVATFFGSLTFLTAFGFNLAAVLFEEFGWRGYALDALQMRLNSLSSSLILGILWFVWHFPLFFINGSYQNELGFGSIGFWIFGINILSQTIIITWIYNNNKRSILLGVLQCKRHDHRKIFKDFL